MSDADAQASWSNGSSEDAMRPTRCASRSRTRNVAARWVRSPAPLAAIPAASTATHDVVFTSV